MRKEKREREEKTYHDIIKNDTIFLRSSAAQLFNLLLLVFFDDAQGLDGFCHIRKHTVRAHVQSFLNVVCLPLQKHVRIIQEI